MSIQLCREDIATLHDILLGLVNHLGVPVKLVTKSADVALLLSTRRVSHLRSQVNKEAVIGDFDEEVWGSWTMAGEDVDTKFSSVKRISVLLRLYNKCGD